MLVTTPESVKAVPGWNCRPPVLGGLVSFSGIEALDLLASVRDLLSPANTAKQGCHEVGGMVLVHLAGSAPVTLEAPRRWSQRGPEPGAFRLQPSSYQSHTITWIKVCRTIIRGFDSHPRLHSVSD